MNILVVGSEGRMGGFHRKTIERYGHNVLAIDTVLSQSGEEQRDLMDAAERAVIASPTNTHHDWAHALISRGIPILIEKPVASSLTQAVSIRTAADFNGVPVHVGYLNRFNRAWRDFSDGVANSPGRFWANRSGRLVGREYGGAGLDLGTHDIDLIYQKWPDAIIRNTVKTIQVAQFEVYVPSANVSGRVTARYSPKTKAPNVRDWTFVSNTGDIWYTDLTAQCVRYPDGIINRYNEDQLEEQFARWYLNQPGVATIEDGIRNMEAMYG